MAGSSTSSVITALAANSVVSVAKFVGFSVSGSGAMLSEAIHSVADTANQSLLLLGLKRSERAPDEAHPEGYGRARFFWGLVSALGIFFLGAGVTLYHGVHALLHPSESSHGWVTWAVLVFAVVVEAGALAVAIRGLLTDARAAGISAMAYFKEGRDPTLTAVLLEDGAAVLGLLFAIVGIGLEQYTGSPFYDAFATLCIGVLLAVVALFLVAVNRSYLLSRAIDDEVLEHLHQVIDQRESVESVNDLRGVILTLGQYRVGARIDFKGGVLADRVLDRIDLDALREEMGDDASARAALEQFAEQVLHELDAAVDAIEEDIKAKVPGVQHLDLEADE